MTATSDEGTRSGPAAGADQPAFLSRFRPRGAVWLAAPAVLVLLVVLALLFLRLPSGFLPNEDQGRVQVQFRLPAGATQGRTLEVRDAIEKYMFRHEKANTQALFLIAGGGGGAAAGQNTGQGFVNLTHWDDRPGKENTAEAIAERARKALSGLRDAQIFALVPGAVRGLGDNAGFTMEFQNRSGMSRAEFAAVREVPVPMLAGMALLAGFVVAAGLAPQPIVDRLIQPAVEALVDRAGYIAAILGGN